MSLVLENTVYSYAGGFRLAPVNLSLQEGKFLVLLGPNGSGKSTLFGLMNGLLRPRGGRVLLAGREVHRIPPRERAVRMGLVPQLSDRNFDFTVEEMVRMGRFPHQSLFARESAGDLRMIRTCLERLELDTMANRSIRSLSGGEYQRVLLCRVLVQDPEILLLDEPANHLDLKHQDLLLSLLREETLRGKSVVAVLHDINQALLYGDRGLLLHRGQTVAEGPPEEILTGERIREVYGVELEEYRNREGTARLFGPGKKNLPSA